MELIEITYNLYLIILPLIFIAGFIDAIAGGGGLISLPAYLVAGLPTHLALANNKFSSCFGTFFSTARYLKHDMIDIKIAGISAIFALAGSYSGAKTVLLIDPFFLNYILVFLLPLITIFTFFNKNLGLTNTSSEISFQKKIIISILAGFVVGFYDGFFGPGTGAFLILIFTVLLKYDFQVANGNTKVINLASNIAALVAFIINGKVFFIIGIPAAIAGIAGNLLGSKYVIKKGNKLIRPIFLVVFLLLFIKILIDITQ
ncbi:MAG: TSUP family transporter [Candidatus Cloacimonetes bacterium]|nr:TSUP family transporter [Candidatus Cloacimonadota bacterium]